MTFRLPSREAGPWLVLALILLLATLVRASIAGIPLERDEGEYAYIAQRWLAGDLPYLTSFNQKFPGTFVAYAAITTLFGESAAAIHWGAHLVAMATVVLVFLLGRKLFSTPAGLVAAALTALIGADASVLGQAANTETFAILFYVASFYAAVHAVERGCWVLALAAGALGMGGMLCKQPGLFHLVFVFGYVALFAPRRIAQAGALVAGAAVAFALVAGYFALNGAWAAFHDNTLAYNLAYASLVTLAEYPRLLWQGFAPILVSFWPVALLALLGALGPALLRPSEAPVAGPEGERVRRNGLVVVACLAMSFLAISAGGYYRQHYFIQAIPAVALLAGLGTTLAAAAIAQDKLRSALPWAACAFAALVALFVSRDYYLPGSPDAKARALYGTNPFPESAAIGQYIADRSAASDRVFIMGSEPQILFHANRRSATRYILAYPLMAPHADTRARQEAAIAEVRAADPKFIVTVFLPSSLLPTSRSPFEIFDDLRAFMGQRYVPVGATVRIEGQLRFVVGDAVSRTYASQPIWYDSPQPWTPLILWERRD